MSHQLRGELPMVMEDADILNTLGKKHGRVLLTIQAITGDAERSHANAMQAYIETHYGKRYHPEKDLPKILNYLDGLRLIVERRLYPTQQSRPVLTLDGYATAERIRFLALTEPDPWEMYTRRSNTPNIGGKIHIMRATLAA
jgi:hypothetical protein